LLREKPTDYATVVTTNAKTRRRWFGGLCLLLAAVMLIAGETFLEGRLAGVTLIGYWLGCFVLTALAAGAAVVDAAHVRNEIRDEQRALLERTLQEIEREKRTRQDTPD